MFLGNHMYIFTRMELLEQVDHKVIMNLFNFIPWGGFQLKQIAIIFRAKLALF